MTVYLIIPARSALDVQGFDTYEEALAIGLTGLWL